MRRSIIAGLIAGLVIGSAGGTVLAQGDATGPETAVDERVEVAEADATAQL